MVSSDSKRGPSPPPPDTRCQRRCTSYAWNWRPCPETSLWRVPSRVTETSGLLAGAALGLRSLLVRREQVQAAEAVGMDTHHGPEMDHPGIRPRWNTLHHHRDRGPHHVCFGPPPPPPFSSTPGAAPLPAFSRRYAAPCWNVRLGGGSGGRASELQHPRASNDTE